jgi:hypothetical protein
VTAETDITAINDGGANTASEVRTALTSVLNRSIPQDSWLSNLFVRPSTESAHDDDDEFDTDSSADWTEVDISAGGGMDFNIGAHVASFMHDASSGASGDYQGILKSLGSLTSPVTIETVWEGMGGGGTNGHGSAFLTFSDGVIGSSNHYSTCYVAGADLRANYGTLTALDSSFTVAAAIGSDMPGFTGRLYMRAIWKSANTWTSQWSVDGAHWHDWGLGNPSKTMTPTHFGLGWLNWGAAESSIAKFEYFRVYESDLS